MVEAFAMTSLGGKTSGLGALDKRGLTKLHLPTGLKV